MPHEATHSTRRYLLWLALLLAVLILYAAFRIVFPAQSPPMSTQATIQQPVLYNAPAPTAADYVSAQEDFQHLVSFTNVGFSPAAFSIKKGETVRFVNNSLESIVLTIGSQEPHFLAQGAYVQYTASDLGGIPFTDGVISGTLMVTE